MDRVATSILAFEGAGKVELYGGNWQSYVDRKAEIAAMREPIPIREAPAATIPAPPPAAAARKKKLTYGERIELESILDAIAKAEQKVGELETSLSDPSLYAAPDRAKTLKNALEHAQADVQRLTARWEDLEARK